MFLCLSSYGTLCCWLCSCRIVNCAVTHIYDNDSSSCLIKSCLNYIIDNLVMTNRFTIIFIVKKYVGKDNNSRQFPAVFSVESNCFICFSFNLYK